MRDMGKWLVRKGIAKIPNGLPVGLFLILTALAANSEVYERWGGVGVLVFALAAMIGGTVVMKYARHRLRVRRQGHRRRP